MCTNQASMYAALGLKVHVYNNDDPTKSHG